MNLPSSIALSAKCENCAITIRISSLRNSPATATGIASDRASSVVAPERIANAVAMTLPSCMFGGPAAPIATKPMDINSNEAPRIIPCFISPKTKPANVLKIRGLPIFWRPINLESTTATNETKPNNIALISIIFLLNYDIIIQNLRVQSVK